VKNNRKFIVLEGISGSGKTELGTRLSRQISAQYYTTPPAMFRTIREEADRILCLKSRFLFYLSSVVQASWEISKILENQSVACDKYIWSTICYHRVYGLNVMMPHSTFYLQPDYSFLVVCEEEKRLERLLHRGIIKDREQYYLRQELERRCLVEFRKYLQQEIDNTTDGPQHAVDKILAVI
jgi:thymidylate kinase